MGLTVENTKNLSEREFFFALLKNNIKTTIFYGIIALIIVFAARWNWYLGIVLFVPFAVLGIVSFLQSVGTLLSGSGATITYFFIKKHGDDQETRLVEGVSPSDQSFVFGSSVVQLIAGLSFLVFVLYILGVLVGWW